VTHLQNTVQASENIKLQEKLRPGHRNTASMMTWKGICNMLIRTLQNVKGLAIICICTLLNNLMSGLLKFKAV